MSIPTLTGCRACRHYSVGRLWQAISTPNDPWGHKCNYHGREKYRIIREAVTGPAQPVDVPEWCPLNVQQEAMAL